MEGAVLRERIPPGVLRAAEALMARGFQAYLVGGSLRDLLLGRRPHDFDLATDARPEEVQAVFPRSVPVGAAFGSVRVEAEPGLWVDVTTFRRDLDYADGRRPAGVAYGVSIQEDLARRDFTVNALAWHAGTGELVDPFGGARDLERRLIRTVGDPVQRLREDALRLLRAVRFAAQLDFDIDLETWTALEAEAAGIRRLSAERVRDELFKILAVDDVGRALWMMRETGLLFETLPELKGTDRLLQHKRGAPTLLDHLIQTASHCPPDPLLRLAALVHDVGKLVTRAVQPDGRVTFYGHEKAGAEAARRLGARLRLSNSEVERLEWLVGMHMSLTPGRSKKALRRWLAQRGEGWVRDLVALCRADARASGWEGALPHIERIEREIQEIVAKGEALTRADLAVDGRDVMRELGIGPGPRVGRILARLYERVLEDPELNTRAALLDLLRRMAQDQET
ncbi:MAG: polynucleotide adenylyltransferase [Firmicutes bacterium]|nr:polynucleotide adenylyltransferase [Bacillota bacterium]MBO2520942.1 polynucleotide adenylyltransferase [Bacillota bacterium]